MNKFDKDGVLIIGMTYEKESTQEELYDESLVRGMVYEEEPIQERVCDESLVRGMVYEEEPIQERVYDENLVKGIIYEDESLQENLVSMESYQAQSTEAFLQENNSLIMTKRIIPAENKEKTTAISETLLEDVRASELNFDLLLSKKIIKVVDTENGEQLEYFYKIQIIIYTYNNETKVFETVVDGARVKNFDWITKTTNSLATVPYQCH